MPRPAGSRVMSCTCGSKVVGMPGQTKKCAFCNAKIRITKKVVEKKAANGKNGKNEKAAKKMLAKAVTKLRKTAKKLTKKLTKKNTVAQVATA